MASYWRTRCLIYILRIDVIPDNLNLIIAMIKSDSYTTVPHGTQYDFEWLPADAVNHKFNYTLQWSKATARFNHKHAIKNPLNRGQMEFFHRLFHKEDRIENGSLDIGFKIIIEKNQVQSSFDN